MLSSPAKLNALLEPLKALQTELHQQRPSAKTLSAILTASKTSPAPLNGWLYSIALSQRNLGILPWERQGYSTCHGLLDNRYPFVKTATSDVSLSSFGYYFAQSGTLSMLFNNTLSPFVDTSKAQWQWKYVNPTFAQNNNATLLQFERSNLVRQLYFDNKNHLSVPFTLTPVSQSPSVEKVELLVNGKPSTQTQFTWPKDTENFSLVITDKDGNTHSINEKGSWALFKLLDKAEVVAHANNQKFDVNFTVDGYRASYLLTAQPLNPFIPGIITSFGCPKFVGR